MGSSLTGSGGFGNSTGMMKEKVPSGYKKGQINNFTPEQMDLFRQLFSQVSPDSDTARLAGGDQSYFDEMEAPALRQFNDIQGNIASRFSGMGSGARRSSGFQNTNTAAASNFSQDLASRRQSLQRQAIQDLMGMGQTLLSQRPQENYLVEKQNKQGGLGGLLGAGVGAAGGFFAGGPAGALKGGQLGYGIGSAF